MVMSKELIVSKTNLRFKSKWLEWWNWKNQKIETELQKWILFIILFYVLTKSICKYITGASQNRLGDRIILRCRLGNPLHRGDNWCYKELWEQKAWTKVQRVPTFHGKSKKRESHQKSERNPEFSLPWFALSHVSKTRQSRNEQTKIWKLD